MFGQMIIDVVYDVGDEERGVRPRCASQVRDLHAFGEAIVVVICEHVFEGLVKHGPCLRYHNSLQQLLNNIHT